MKRIMVLTKITDDFEFSHEEVIPQLPGETRKVFNQIKKAAAAVWSSDEKRFSEGRTYAKDNGWDVWVLDDTHDILEKARALALSQN